MPLPYFEIARPAADFQADFDTLVLPAGSQYRVTSMAAYGPRNNQKFAAIMRDVGASAPPQYLELDLSYDEVEEREAEYRMVNVYPKLITVVSNPAEGQLLGVEAASYSVLFEHLDPPPSDPERVPHIVRAAPLDDLKNAQVFAAHNLGGKWWEPWLITSFDAYVASDQGLTYAAILAPRSYPRLASNLDDVLIVDGLLHPMGPDAWDGVSRHAVMREGWVRADIVVPSPITHVGDDGEPRRRVITQWVSNTFDPWPDHMWDKSFTGGALVRGPMPPEKVEAVRQLMESQGYLPYSVAANGRGEDERVCVLFTKQPKPLPRWWVVVNGTSLPPEKVTPTASFPFKDVYGSIVGAGGLQMMMAQPEAGLSPDASWRVLQRPPSLGERPAFETSAFRRGGATEAIPIQGSSNPGPDAPIDPPITALFDFSPLDSKVHEIMNASGARAAQLAVARDGRLVVMRAYTWAEKNYPVASNTHQLRIGSIAKPLTGMAVVRFFMREGSDPSVFFGPGIPDVLDIAINQEDAGLVQKLTDTTLYHLLSHNAGWPSDVNYAEVAFAAGNVVAQPGDLSRWLELRDTDFYAYLPGQYPVASGISNYSGATVRLLAEGISHKLFPELQTRTGYPDAMRLWMFGQQDSGRATLVEQPFESIFNRKQVPVHDRWPRWQVVTDKDGNQAERPVQYTGPDDFSAGAGGWCMSAAELARVTCSIEKPVGPELLNAAQRKLVRSGLRDLITGYTCLWRYTSNPDGTTMTLEFYGGIEGGASGAKLWLPSPNGPSMCVVLLLDTDFDQSPDVNAIGAIVLQMEAAAGGWPNPWGNNDYFAALG